MKEFHFSYKTIFVCDRLYGVSNSIDDGWSLSAGERRNGETQSEFLFVADRVVTQYADATSREFLCNALMYRVL